MFSENVIRQTFLSGLVPNIQFKTLFFQSKYVTGQFFNFDVAMFIDRILQELSIRQDFAAQNYNHSFHAQD